MTETPPDFAQVSVIVPAYQADEDLPHCLAALREDGGPELDILVVDDASPDSDAAKALAELQQTLDEIRSSQSIGTSR